MDIADLIPVLLGAAVALAGVAISEFGQSRRAARAEKIVEKNREEFRRAELWQISIPPASRIRDSFAKVARVATPEDPWVPEEEPWDDDGFESWWYREEQQVSRDIALIPSAELRADLTIVAKGVSYSWALVNKLGFRANQRTAAADIGCLGFELISTWMRDERTAQPELEEVASDLKSRLLELDSILASEVE